MATSAPYTLCRIQRGERTYYYALFRNPETGKRTNKKSVESLRKALGMHDPTPIRRRDEAIRICQKALDAGIIFTQKRETTLYTYLSNFYDWESSTYVKRRNLLEPGSLSPDYFSNRKNLLTNHILPLIDTNLLLSKVTLGDLETMQMALVSKQTLSHTTINMCMSAVQAALREAQRKGDLPHSVILHLTSLKANHAIRGILSEQELSDFMNYAKINSEKRIYYACLLSLLTGMRSGELRGLRVHAIAEDIITIDQAYADIAGLKSPKGKKTRYVPCPAFLCNALKAMALENPYANPLLLVFWSKRNGGFVSSHYFSERFQQELERSHVLTKQAIQERNITFHSLRHMANTLLRGSVDEHILRLTIGHSSQQLSDLYTHLNQRALKSVQLAQQSVILPLLEGLQNTMDQQEEKHKTDVDQREPH
ncbi:tyrosine-type recombinase/integrase [Sphaerochaeta sp.]|jgi:integrase|uniref:tyrosine-type recombinase/integrase n=1 Tax=Sphaerochaeta sp. TaxID=1972642 RepID=UPI002FC62977